VSDDFFRDPKLYRLIKKMFRRTRFTAEAGIEDAVQDVLEALVRWSRSHDIASTEAQTAGASTIAKNLAITWGRDQHVDRKHNAGSTDEADESSRPEDPSALELPDVRKLLAEIDLYVKESGMSEKSAALLFAVADETSLAEHAEATQQSPAAVRKTHERIQKKLVEHVRARGLADVGLRKLLSRAGGAAALAVLLFLVYSGRLPLPESDWLTWGHKLPQKPSPLVPEPRVPPGPSAVPEEAFARTQEQRDAAARKVGEAEAAYKAREWRKCLLDLEAAKKLDVTVGTSPALEKDCQDRYNNDSNVKSPPTPQ